MCHAGSGTLRRSGVAGRCPDPPDAETSDGVGSQEGKDPVPWSPSVQKPDRTVIPDLGLILAGTSALFSKMQGEIGAAGSWIGCRRRTIPADGAMVHQAPRAGASETC